MGRCQPWSAVAVLRSALACAALALLALPSAQADELPPWRQPLPGPEVRPAVTAPNSSSYAPPRRAATPSSPARVEPRRQERVQPVATPAPVPGFPEPQPVRPKLAAAWVPPTVQAPTVHLEPTGPTAPTAPARSRAAGALGPRTSSSYVPSSSRDLKSRAPTATHLPAAPRPLAASSPCNDLPAPAVRSVAITPSRTPWTAPAPSARPWRAERDVVAAAPAPTPTRRSVRTRERSSARPEGSVSRLRPQPAAPGGARCDITLPPRPGVGFC